MKGPEQHLSTGKNPVIHALNKLSGRKNVLQDNSQVFEMKEKWHFGPSAFIVIALIVGAFSEVGLQGLKDAVENINLENLELLKQIYLENKELTSSYSDEIFVFVGIFIFSILFGLASFFNQVAYIRMDSSQLITKSRFDLRLGRGGKVRWIAPPVQIVHKVVGKGSKLIVKISIQQDGRSQNIKIRVRNFGSNAVSAFRSWLVTSRQNKPKLY